MTKHEHVAALAQVTIDHARWHSSDGWFCDRCETECGAAPVELCRCCSDALKRRGSHRMTRQQQHAPSSRRWG